MMEWMSVVNKYTVRQLMIKMFDQTKHGKKEYNDKISEKKIKEDDRGDEK